MCILYYYFGLLDKHTPKMRFRFINNEKLQLLVKTNKKKRQRNRKSKARSEKKHDSEKQTKKEGNFNGKKIYI